MGWWDGEKALLVLEYRVLKHLSTVDIHTLYPFDCSIMANNACNAHTLTLIVIT